jgi:hypothetical protein
MRPRPEGHETMSAFRGVRSTLSALVFERHDRFHYAWAVCAWAFCCLAATATSAGNYGRPYSAPGTRDGDGNYYSTAVVALGDGVTNHLVVSNVAVACRPLSTDFRGGGRIFHSRPAAKTGWIRRI